MDFEQLKNNIIDNIVESQVKIGYEKTQMSLYYPTESVMRLLGECSAENLKQTLDEFCGACKDIFGEITASVERDRVRFLIPVKGVEYVHTEITDRGFIEDFISTIRGSCTIEDILAVFGRYSDSVVCEELNNGEFEYLIYFADGKPDSYRYCIEFEMGRAVYHRFTAADYEALDL
ncbi:MAG: DUF3877 family protein [Oscillospiraceae bacterium]